MLGKYTSPSLLGLWIGHSFPYALFSLINCLIRHGWKNFGTLNNMFRTLEKYQLISDPFLPENLQLVPAISFRHQIAVQNWNYTWSNMWFVLNWKTLCSLSSFQCTLAPTFSHPWTADLCSLKPTTVVRSTDASTVLKAQNNPTSVNQTTGVVPTAAQNPLLRCSYSW